MSTWNSYEEWLHEIHKPFKRFDETTVKEYYKVNELSEIYKNKSMETKEIKINVPEGYEIDKENSSFECIKFKKKEIKPWRRSHKVTSGYSLIGRKISDLSDDLGGKALYTTKKQAKSALAMAQISQIMANDERFGGPITDEEWEDTDIKKWVIRRRKNDVCVDFTYNWYFFLAFHTEEQQLLFIKENEDLVKDYLMAD